MLAGAVEVATAGMPTPTGIAMGTVASGNGGADGGYGACQPACWTGPGCFIGTGDDDGDWFPSFTSNNLASRYPSSWSASHSSQDAPVDLRGVSVLATALDVTGRGGIRLASAHPTASR